MNLAAKAESKMLGWQDHIYDLPRQNQIMQFAYVPDAGHRSLIDRSLADPQVHSVALTTEEEGVALLAGADLEAMGVTCLRADNPEKALRTVAAALTWGSGKTGEEGRGAREAQRVPPRL